MFVVAFMVRLSRHPIRLNTCSQASCYTTMWWMMSEMLAGATIWRSGFKGRPSRPNYSVCGVLRWCC
jgi:hypothetical protein